MTDITTSYLDSGSDSPRLARSALLETTQRVNSLAASSGSSLVAHIASGTGATATTVQAKLRDQLDAVNDFGCDNTGATNTTTKLLAFYNACIAQTRRGHIPAGTYKVTTGVLIFDNAQADKTWPDISTDGHLSTIFAVDAATATNAPILEWKNGTPGSATLKSWYGGSHGGLTFTDATGATAALRSGISLTGVWGLRFGYMKCTSLRGDGVTIPAHLYGGTNPDPYAVSNVYFEGIEANSCAGWGVQNLNYVGMDSWTIDHLRVTSGTLGGIYGIGSGCEIGLLVVANTNGWAFDDGTQSGAAGGSPQRNTVHVAELDNVQNGIRLNKSSYTTFRRTRFIHRYQTSPNASANYYPRIGIKLAGGTDENVNNVEMQVFHRIESGGALGGLGAFCAGSSSGNLSAVSIDQDFADNGSLGVTNANLFSNFATSSVVHLTRRTRSLWDRRDKAMSYAVGSASTSIPITGFGGATPIVFGSQAWATYSTPYNVSTYKFTAPRAGVYYVHASTVFAAAAGTRVRLAFVTTSGGTECRKDDFAATTAAQNYEVSGYVVLAAGETVYVTADQNTGAPINSAPASNNNEVRFVVIEQ